MGGMYGGAVRRLPGKGRPCWLGLESAHMHATHEHQSYQACAHCIPPALWVHNPGQAAGHRPPTHSHALPPAPTHLPLAPLAALAAVARCLVLSTLEALWSTTGFWMVACMSASRMVGLGGRGLAPGSALTTCRRPVSDTPMADACTQKVHMLIVFNFFRTVMLQRLVHSQAKPDALDSMRVDGPGDMPASHAMHAVQQEIYNILCFVPPIRVHSRVGLRARFPSLQVSLARCFGQ